MTNNNTIPIGTYVIGAKYGDADPCDPWGVGFFQKTRVDPRGKTRFIVVDIGGNSLYGTGYAEIRKIDRETGHWLLANQRDIKWSDRSLWDLIEGHKTDILRAKYEELVSEVSRKLPGESRHETALRYIREAETNIAVDTAAKEADDDNDK